MFLLGWSRPFSWASLSCNGHYGGSDWWPRPAPPGNRWRFNSGKLFYGRAEEDEPLDLLILPSAPLQPGRAPWLAWSSWGFSWKWKQTADQGTFPISMNTEAGGTVNQGLAMFLPTKVLPRQESWSPVYLSLKGTVCTLNSYMLFHFQSNVLDCRAQRTEIVPTVQIHTDGTVANVTTVFSELLEAVVV